MEMRHMRTFSTGARNYRRTTFVEIMIPNQSFATTMWQTRQYPRAALDGPADRQ